MRAIPKDRGELENYILKQQAAIATFAEKAAGAKKDKVAKRYQHTVDVKSRMLKAAEARLAAMPTKRSRNQES